MNPLNVVTSARRAPGAEAECLTSRHRRSASSTNFVEKVSDLLNRTAQGDATAFSALYDMLAPGIWRAALAACGNDGDARKATEQVFVETWHRAPSLAADSGCPLSQLIGLANQVLREQGDSCVPP